MTFKLPLDSIVGFHPLIANMPGLWPDDSAELTRLAEDIRVRGLDQALIVVRTKEGYVLADGRNRYRGALNGGVTEIDAKECQESEVADIVLHTLIDRRHLTKGALAYISFPVIAEKLTPNGGNRRSASTESTLKSSDDLAAQLGFSRDLFFQARQIHEKFAKRPDLKARFEPLIIGGEIGLGACLAGIAGMDATAGQARNDRPMLQLLFAGFADLRNRFSKWTTLTESDRAQVLDKLTETVFELPPDVQTSLHTALKAKHA